MAASDPREPGLVKRPGPKKIQPFDCSVLDAEIRSLDHGRKRSAGTTELYRRHHFELSRRELARMVEQVRQDLLADHRRHLRRIEWVTPGVVWAMDGTQYDMGLTGKIYLCNMQDLGSRYKFLPLAGGYPVGEQIAEHLSESIDRYGAPLVLKRDNEGTLNHADVNEILKKSFVLSLNSPRDYAPYNGRLKNRNGSSRVVAGEACVGHVRSPEPYCCVCGERSERPEPSDSALPERPDLLPGVFSSWHQTHIYQTPKEGDL